MTDDAVPADTLVDQLRERYEPWLSLEHASGREHGRLLLEAAAEIKRLTTALDEIRDVSMATLRETPADRLDAIYLIARRALEGPTDDDA